MTTEYTTHMSNRDIPLVYIKNNNARKVLTVENYCKWYSLYLVLPDGEVTEVSATSDAYEAAYNQAGGTTYDHVFYPTFVLKLAEQLDAYLDPQSFEVIVGRYRTEVLEDYITE